jgi:hypothetical protein
MTVIAAQFSQVCSLADSTTPLPVTETAQIAYSIHTAKSEHIKGIRKKRHKYRFLLQTVKIKC